MLDFKKDVSLKIHTTFKTGGLAKFFVEVKSIEEFQKAADFSKKHKLPIFILGGGSNVLISDSGLDAVVVKNSIRGVSIQGNDVTVSSGEDWNHFVGVVVEKNLAGIECLSGIPGTVGGAVVQNIGAYGQTIADSIKSVDVWNYKTDKLETWNKTDCQFEYRNSYFKKHPDKLFVLAVKFRLSLGGQPTTSYPDVQKFLINAGATSLSDVRKAVIEIRAKKGYVILPGYKAYNSAGSFFKNPIVDQKTFEYLQNKFADRTNTWFWPEKKKYKLAAAFLLGQAGFEKGYVSGRVGISPKHSLALINIKNATSKEIFDLSKMIQSAVHNRFNVILEPEVQIVGKFD